MGGGHCLHKKFKNLLPKPCRNCRWRRCIDKSSLYWKTVQFDKFNCRVKTRVTKLAATNMTMTTVTTITFSVVDAKRYLMCQLVLEILTNWLQQDLRSKITRSFCTDAVVPAWVRRQSELK